MKTSPHGYVTSPEFAKQAEEIYNFEPRSDDVYVLTFPKCGKWAQTRICFKKTYFTIFKIKNKNK